MVFAPTDDPRVKQVKLDVIGMYNHRLDEREKRTQFVVEHNLPDSKEQPGASCSKKMPKVKIDILNKIAVSSGGWVRGKIMSLVLLLLQSVSCINFYR